jgi:ADP-ribose pyrophosphatase YjhB (NUDIX family)
MREIEEETGWRPSNLEHLLTFQPMVGMVDSPHELFIGHGASYVGEPTDIEEAGQVAWVPLAEVPDLVAKDKLLGAGTLVALLHILAERGCAKGARGRGTADEADDRAALGWEELLADAVDIEPDEVEDAYKSEERSAAGTRPSWRPVRAAARTGRKRSDSALGGRLPAGHEETTAAAMTPMAP